MRAPRWALVAPVALVLSGVLTGCTSDATDSSSSGSSSSPSGPNGPGENAVAVDDAALDAAESTPVEDRVYPRVGDPSVDALHYDLDLTWAPRSRTLTGVETLVFRATADAAGSGRSPLAAKAIWRPRMATTTRLSVGWKPSR